jgi:hypothetical protein
MSKVAAGVGEAAGGRGEACGLGAVCAETDRVEKVKNPRISKTV